MLLGKRPRRPVRRTTSMSGFSSDMLIVETHHQLEREPEAKDTSGDENSSSCESGNCSSKRPQQKQNYGYQTHHHQNQNQNQNQQQAWSWDGLNTRYNLTAMVSPRNPGRQFGRFPVETTAHFLKACGLCNRRLAPGRDIFMYRGEIAFCSSECRQQQMSIDERKENKKCSLTSIKNDPSPTTASAPATSDGSGSGSGNETTIVAA